jgi:1-deoxy-D-xylulose-5-phosphate reductoisomerase
VIPRPVVVLGATGSIGRQALEVAAHLAFPVVALAARTPSPQLAELAAAHPEAAVAVAGGTRDERRELASRLGGRVSFGPEAVLQAASHPGAVVVNGVVGAAGLRATMAAVEAGNRVALANKESLVAAGRLVMAAVERCGAELVPVDSEHSALFQLVEGRRSQVSRLILTASGGPFRGWSRDQLEQATPEDALQHPTWSMGRRITVDSATLVNKGLEVIEAHMLFDVGFDNIEVVIHPQSLVHSLVELTDGALLAHLGVTDMRIPIQYALTHPQREPALTQRFSLPGVTLGFDPPDLDTFPALALAYQAGRQGGSAPAVFNAADEVAVEAFLRRRLGFAAIPTVIERVLEAVPWREPASVEEVLDVDREAREATASLIPSYC